MNKAPFFIIIPLILLTGCGSQHYVCSDGKIVDDSSLCILEKNQILPQNLEDLPLNENNDTLNPLNENILPLNVNVVLDGFVSIYHRYLKLQENEETRIYKKYGDVRVGIFELSSEKYYINNYRDLFDFVVTETRIDSQEYIDSEGEPYSFVLKWVVEEEGITRHIWINRHVLFAYKNYQNLLEHDYTKIVYTWCAPNIIIGIKVDKGLAGWDKYPNLDALFANVFNQGKTYQEGIRKKSTERETVSDNFSTLRSEGVCLLAPESFNDGFEKLKEEETREVSWD